MLDLDFTEEQDMLREMVRGVCGQYAPFEVVRELEDDPDRLSRPTCGRSWATWASAGCCSPRSTAARA